MPQSTQARTINKQIRKFLLTIKNTNIAPAVAINAVRQPVIYSKKKLIKVYKKRLNIRYVALVISCITVILLHGTLDYTIFWVHTGILFLLLSSSFGIYENSGDLEREIEYERK